MPFTFSLDSPLEVAIVFSFVGRCQEFRLEFGISSLTINIPQVETPGISALRPRLQRLRTSVSSWFFRESISHLISLKPKRDMQTLLANFVSFATLKLSREPRIVFLFLVAPAIPLAF